MLVLGQSIGTKENKKMSNNKGFQVAFRQGGPQRFRWSRVLTNYSTKKEALAECNALLAQGMWAIVQPWGAGLPETYSPEQSVEDVTVLESGWSCMVDPLDAAIRDIQRILDLTV
jgi:hypothetical protein